MFAGLGIAWLGKGEKGKKRGEEERGKRETPFILGRPKWIEKFFYFFIFLYHHLLFKSFKQSCLEEFYKKKGGYLLYKCYIFVAFVNTLVRKTSVLPTIKM